MPANSTQAAILSTDEVVGRALVSAKVTQLVHDLVSQGRWDEAHAVLSRWSAQSPDDPDTQFQVGMLSYTIGRFAEAERLLRQCLATRENIEALYYLGLSLVKLNRPQEAVGCFRTACEKREGFAIAHLHWGIALMQMGSMRGALGQFRQAISVNPRLVAAAYQAGVASYELGQYSDAVEFFAEACEKDQNLAEAFNGLGVALGALGQYEKALNCFQRAWQVNDKLPVIKRNWASALVNLGRLDEAAKQYNDAVNLNPKVLDARERALVYNDWGVNLYRQGKIEESAEKLLQAVNIDPGILDARLNLGIVKNAMQEYEQAADSFEKALEIDPHSPITNMHLGVSYFLLGQFEPALVHLQKASGENAPQAVELWIGYTQIALGQYGAAEAQFGKVLHNHPDNFLAFDGYGTALACQGKFAEAIDKFKRCLKIHDHFALGHLHLAKCLEASGKSEEATVEFKVAVKKDRNCLAAEKEALEMLLKQSNFDEVFNRSRRLLELVPNDEDAAMALARSLKAQNRLEDAEQVLDAIVRNYPNNGPAQVLQGLIYMSQGKLLEADEKFRVASTLYEGDVSLFFGWGKALGLLGLHELALEKFEKANEIDPYDGDTYEAWGATLKALGRFAEAGEVFKRASEYL